MKIDKLIHELEELRSKYEDLHVYVWDQDCGWEEFSVQLYEKHPHANNPPNEEELWIALV